jgi:hypothetical protein
VVVLLIPACVSSAAQMLRCVSRTSLSTKLAPNLVEQLTDIVTDAVLTIKQPDQPLDLYMVRGPALGLAQKCAEWGCLCITSGSRSSASSSCVSS